MRAWSCRSSRNLLSISLILILFTSCFIFRAKRRGAVKGFLLSCVPSILSRSYVVVHIVSPTFACPS